MSDLYQAKKQKRPLQAEWSLLAGSDTSIIMGIKVNFK
jgi:hypothetical protein